MASLKPRHSKEEFAQRGEAIYNQRIRALVQPTDRGKFVAIDIDTGDYEIDENELAACDRLQARRPEAQIWLMRAGLRHARRFGLRPQSEAT